MNDLWAAAVFLAATYSVASWAAWTRRRADSGGRAARTMEQVRRAIADEEPLP